MSVAYRPYRPQDEPSQRELFRLCFPEMHGTAGTQAHREWKFRSCPAHDDRPSLEYVGVDGGRVVAYYAALPYRYRIEGREVTAGMVCDVMTHPEYRGRGLFTAIGRFALERMREAGIAFTTGYPVRPEVMPGHLKVGWRVVDEMPVWVRPLKTRALLTGPVKALSTLLDPVTALLPRPRPTAGHAFVQLDRDRFFEMADSPAFERLRENVESLGCSLIRDRDFLAWRTGAPGSTYEYYAVLEDGEVLAAAIGRRAPLREIDSLALLDVMLDSRSPLAASALLSGTIERARLLDVDVIAIMCSRARASELRLVRSGFLASPARFSLIVRELDTDSTPVCALDAKAWRAKWIDSDDL